MAVIKGLPEQKQRVPDSRSLSRGKRHVLRWDIEEALDSGSDGQKANPGPDTGPRLLVCKIKITVITQERLPHRLFKGLNKRIYPILQHYLLSTY